MVRFWIKDSGNYFSAGGGLTKQQVQFLRSLKVGDRLVLWQETPTDPDHADLTLKQYITNRSKTE